MANSNDTGVPQTPASEAVTKVETVAPVVLHVTTPLQSGPQVLDVQKKLSALGFYSGPFDSIYGPATETAVRAFQKARGLACDGIVGPMTLAALLVANPSSPSASSSFGLLALDEAKKHLGLKESPPNSNKTPFGVWYGHDGLRWCSIFVSYCFAVGANKLICDGFLGPGVKVGKGCAYVPTVEAWLKATGQWLGNGPNVAQPGDIVIFDFDGTGPDHIGIVVQNTGDGHFLTIEGNTSPDNQANGGEVMTRARMISQVSGFGRVV